MKTLDKILQRCREATRFERVLIVIGAIALFWGLIDAGSAQSFILIDCGDWLNYIPLGESREPFLDNKWQCYWKNFNRILPINVFLWRVLQGALLIAALATARWVWMGPKEQVTD